MEKVLTSQIFFLNDVEVASLNNAGIDTSTNTDNGVKTKSIKHNGKTYVYASGEAVRYWIRETLKKNFGWDMSPIQIDSKIARTSANPVDYADDDIFGYMAAIKKKTLSRVGALRNSALISVCPVNPVTPFMSMTRQNGNPVPYSHQEYSATMKQMISLDLANVGTFSAVNRSGYLNINEDTKKKALSSGAKEIADELNEGQTLIRMPRDVRYKRATDVIKSLKTISGGAMQTANMADVTPKFIILVTTVSGNHPFSHITKGVGEYENDAKVDIDALRDVLEDYKDTFKGKVFIGRRKGFLDDMDADFKALADEYGIEYTSVNKAIDAYCETLYNEMA